MKKRLLSPFVILVATVLISWGGVGHKTVATIAEKNLTFKAVAGVRMLLGDTSMADVASWADEVLRQPEYKFTAPWHYVNVPLGLNYAEFSKTITEVKTPNVYSALQQSLHVLTHTDNPPHMRAEALKFIIHLVGDLHQPMHVSRAEDKGGNTIQVQFNGTETNLHSLWDSKLIGKEGKTFEQMAIDYDTATPEQIKQWQSDDILQWLFESYQISSKLYADVEKNTKLDDTYYNEYMPVVRQRIEMAGIRLAGLLNDAFKDLNVKATKVVLQPPPPIDKPAVPMALGAELKDLKSLIGKEVTTKGLVYGTKDVGNMILVNVGAAYPNQLLTVVLKGHMKLYETLIDNKTIAVTGTVVDYKGKPEIIVTDERHITILP